jgi:uncharacterized protein DUF4360
VPAAGSIKTVSKNCRVNLKIDPVPGYAPTITSVDYRGFAELAVGSVLQLAATYGFHDATHLEPAVFRLAGPFSDDWQTTDAAEGGLVTGKCTGAQVLDFDSTLSVTSTSAGAARAASRLMATSSIRRANIRRDTPTAAVTKRQTSERAVEPARRRDKEPERYDDAVLQAVGTRVLRWRAAT